MSRVGFFDSPSNRLRFLFLFFVSMNACDHVAYQMRVQMMASRERGNHVMS
uniref:Uncharacterized protein n=1 Tax=Arundo donax TaxID=35708 RepID=A0A0A9HLH3_ARUDO